VPVSPSAADATAAFLAARAVPGIEEASPFRRTVRLAHGPAIVALDGVAAADAHDRAAAPDGVVAAHLRDRAAALDGVVAAHPRDRGAAARAVERLAGADPAPADAHLAGDPVLGPLVAARPGLRMPGTVDGGELAVRAVLGQQVSLAAARTLAGRLVALAGDPLEQPVGGLTHLWPRPEAIAEVAPQMPMPRARQRTLAALAEALAGGLVLERAALLALPGIGPWTAEYVAMRALGDPDAWLPTDLGVRRGLERLGVGAEAADGWRPYRAHAVRHLWALAALGPARPGSTRAPAASRRGSPR
jgi:AraC family transcriptional regulator of adaptative response / DNA-3-methyladenine glycosylase II